MTNQSDLQDLYPRSLLPAIKTGLADTPVVCLLGPRQCGKSTLVKQYSPDRHYIDLDDQNYLQLARSDPQGFIDTLPEEVTIDEIQRAPDLILAIKRSVDTHRKPGRYLLTGSANLLQLPKLADSLAGRMEWLYLHPLTESEIERTPGKFLNDWIKGEIKVVAAKGKKPEPFDLARRLVAGGYPEAVRRTPKRARNWQRQYLQSIIERDVRDIADIKYGSDLIRLLEYISLQTASLVNVSSIAAALGHTRPTIERYIDLLEKLFLVRRLPAWHSNRSKRLVKAPKIHLCDSGLAATLSQLSENQWNEERNRFGHLLESFVLQQLTAMMGWSEDESRFWHYRDKDQVEVDIVVETGTEIRGIEIKASASVRPTDGKGLLRLAEIAGKRFKGGIILYHGVQILPVHRKENILAVPIDTLWRR
jgi:predicted AAA+ superfamily ATPase